MCYAFFGIPLGLVMFQSIGERLNTFVRCALKYAKRFLRAKNPEVTQTNLVAVVLALSTILMTSMAKVFAIYERWDYFDAFYYCFITLTTIGFGDYVALQKDSALQTNPQYVVLSLVFILFGLSVVSSAVNLLVLKFLTLNTEDERRDEQLRYTANLNSISLEGDVITPASIRQQLQLQLQQQQQQHPEEKHRNDRDTQDDGSTGGTSSIRMRKQSRRLSPPPPPPFYRQHQHRHQRAAGSSRRAAQNDRDDNSCERHDSHYQNRDISGNDRTESNVGHHGRTFVDSVSLAPPEVAGGQSDRPSGGRRRTDSTNHQPHHQHHKRTRHRCKSGQRPLDDASLSLNLVNDELGTCSGAHLALPRQQRQQSCLSSSSSQPPQEALAYWCESLCDMHHHHHLHASSIVIDDCSGHGGLDEGWPHYSDDNDDDDDDDDYQRRGKEDDGRYHVQHAGRPLEQLSDSASSSAGQQVEQLPVHPIATQQPAEGHYRLSAAQTCRHGRRPESKEQRSASGGGANSLSANERGQLAQATSATSNIFQAASSSLTSSDEAGKAKNSEQPPQRQTSSSLSIVSLGPTAPAPAPAPAPATATALSSSGCGGGQRVVSSGYCDMAATAEEHGALHGESGDCRQRRRHRHQREHICSGSTTTAAAASYRQRPLRETAASSVQQDDVRRQRAGTTTMELPLIGAASTSQMSRTDNGLAATFGHSLSAGAMQPLTGQRVPGGYESGDGSAGRTPATKTKSRSVQRLACKCCCQHLECIRHALSSPKGKKGGGQLAPELDKTTFNDHYSPEEDRKNSCEGSHDHDHQHTRRRNREANLSNSTGDLRNSQSSRGQPEVGREARCQLQHEQNQQCERAEIFSIQTSSFRRLLPDEQNEEKPKTNEDPAAYQTSGDSQ